MQDLFTEFGQILTVKVVTDVGVADSVIGFVKYHYYNYITDFFKKIVTNNKI